MVEFSPEPTIERKILHNQPSKPKTLEDTIDPLEAKTNDFSFADSLFDFDSLKDWFEDKPNPDRFSLGNIDFGTLEKNLKMGDDDFVSKSHDEEPISHASGPIFGASKPVVDGVEPSVDGSGCVVKVMVEEREIEGSMGCCIQKQMQKVCLVGGSGSGSVDVEGSVSKSVKMSEEEKEEDSESSEESDSESSSSSSCSSSTSDDSDVVEEEKEEGKGKVEVKKEQVETEEGEISGDGGEGMVGWSDRDDSGGEEAEDSEVMVGGSEVEFDDADLEDEDEDGVGGGATQRPIRSKNEIQDLPPVPPVDVTLQPHHQTLPVGFVSSIIGVKIIVEGVEKHNPLNEGSILWITESRALLGLVDEIFGPVKNPYYVVRYNSESEVPTGIHEGTSVSFVPEFANHVLNDQNLHKKGYDASNENDEELSDEIEFSDDEKEAEYRRMQKMAKRGINDQKPGNMKKNRKKVKERNERQNNARHSAQQTPIRAGQQPPSQTQYHVSPAATSLAGNNCQSSSAIRPGFVSGAGIIPPFPPMAQPMGFINPSNGIWANGMLCQQPQSAVFPNGYPNNGIPMFPQNLNQHPYQMPMQNLMPFHQQFDPSQRSLPNVGFPGGQSNFFAAPNAPWLGPASQIGFNQATFGMGLQGQPTHPSANVGEQGIQQPAVFQQQPAVFPGNFEASPQFNMPPSSTRSRKLYHHRGGGHSARGRGQR
ncbi:Gar1 domain-containing protein [Cephalotus follicularis]|uniref:H/ACA ribonucleoprotein complex non-core subunit NAF1 n=1 Tax=Cephalotus follicularis TaxID=3775 RepID=A0A1Q3D592_CEPFO|nr:Gar1 domain-containing protein [Cephalotus follicularis]